MDPQEVHKLLDEQKIEILEEVDNKIHQAEQTHTENQIKRVFEIDDQRKVFNNLSAEDKVIQDAKQEKENTDNRTKWEKKWALDIIVQTKD